MDFDNAGGQTLGQMSDKYVFIIQLFLSYILDTDQWLKVFDVYV